MGYAIQMERISLTPQLRKVERYVHTLPVHREVQALERAARNSFLDMQDSLSVALKLARDAERSEDKGVIAHSLTRCLEQLDVFNKALLLASQFDVVSAVDVAQLSAMAEQVRDDIAAFIAQEEYT